MAQTDKLGDLLEKQAKAVPVKPQDKSLLNQLKRRLQDRLEPPPDAGKSRSKGPAKG